MSVGRKSATAAETSVHTSSENSRLTEHLWTEWENVGEALASLAEEEDRRVAAGQDISEELERDIDEAYAQQRKILLDALSIRSKSLSDIQMKLKIWQSHSFGDTVKPHLLQPSDLLIRQAIRELGELKK